MKTDEDWRHSKCQSTMAEVWVFILLTFQYCKNSLFFTFLIYRPPRSQYLYFLSKIWLLFQSESWKTKLAGSTFTFYFLLCSVSSLPPFCTMQQHSLSIDLNNQGNIMNDSQTTLGNANLIWTIYNICSRTLSSMNRFLPQQYQL